MQTTRFSKPFVFLFAAFIVASSIRADGPNASPDEEKALIAILRSDAPGGEKALACKNLAIYGSSDAVGELAKLLPNEQLSSWARIALEAIPGDAADQALRSASDSLHGKLLVGTINSIGVRRDAAAVDSLTAHLSDADTEVASAAAVALGRIGNDAATNALRGAFGSATANVRNAIAEGCVLCAERLHAEGKSDLAAEIYDEVRSADVPMQRIVEATRGAILTRDQDGIPLLLTTLRSPEKKLFQLALGTAREFPGEEIDKALASEVAGATPDRAALIIQAMADRPNTVVLAAVLSAAVAGDKQVRVSAIESLRQVGDDSCLSPLLQIAVEPDADLAAAAKQTLAELPGEQVDAQIVGLLPTSKGDTYTLLLQLIGQRRIDAVTDVLKGLDHSDPAVRGAALVALGEIIRLERLPVLVSQVVSPTHPEDASVATAALRAASVRMPDRAACAAELTNALNQASGDTKSTILEILSDVGGSGALETLAAAAKSADPQLQDTSSRLLGTWNSVDAAPVLLDLATAAPAEKYRVRALRGYIGLARKFAMPEQERAEMCAKAMETARRVDEQKLVLDVLQLHPSVEGLKLAIDARRVPALKSDADAATRVIAQKLRKQGVDVSALMAGSVK